MTRKEFHELYRTENGRWKIREIYEDFVEPILSSHSEGSMIRRQSARALVKRLHEKGFKIYSQNTVKQRGFPSSSGRSLFQYTIIKNPTYAKQLAPHVPLYHKLQSIGILIYSVFGMRDSLVKNISEYAENAAIQYFEDLRSK